VGTTGLDETVSNQAGRSFVQKNGLPENRQAKALPTLFRRRDSLGSVARFVPHYLAFA